MSCPESLAIAGASAAVRIRGMKLRKPLGWEWAIVFVVVWALMDLIGVLIPMYQSGHFSR